MSAMQEHGSEREELLRRNQFLEQQILHHQLEGKAGAHQDALDQENSLLLERCEDLESQL